MNTSETIWHDYHSKLSSFIKSRVDGDVADDILQDVFVKIHTHIESLKDDTRLESWLYQVTRNAISDYYRSRRHSDRLPEWIEQPEPENADEIRQELSSCLQPMINALPDRYRHAMQMSEIDNKTQKVVAEVEGISLSAAKSRVQRGRVLLKAMLYDCCLFEVNRDNQVVSYEKKESDCKFC